MTASLKGDVPHPNASKDLSYLFAKFTVFAAGPYAPGTKSQYKRAWDRLGPGRSPGGPVFYMKCWFPHGSHPNK